jgi:hypothetical protein
VVLLEIHAAGFVILEFKGNAPRSIDVDRITLRIESLQGMKVEARDVHFLCSNGNVEAVESRENAFMHLRINLRTAALRPQLRKGFAFEGSDHRDNVSK